MKKKIDKFIHVQETKHREKEAEENTRKQVELDERQREHNNKGYELSKKFKYHICWKSATEPGKGPGESYGYNYAPGIAMSTDTYYQDDW